MRKRVFAFLVFFPVLVNSQSFTASVRGLVTDPSQAGVPGAKVAARDVDRNTEFTTTTDQAGRYVLTALPPSRYSLTVEATGFKKYAHTPFMLAVDQQAQIDIGLAVGSMAETIEVTAEAPLLESVSSSVGKVVDNRRIVNLPLNSRNVYSLVFLTPGVTGTVGYNYGEMRYSVNGARSRMLDTLIDGAPASHPTVNGAGGISVFPSVDAIEEFKVMGSNFPAEFGRSQGSVLNVIFKSGSNTFHGSVYEFLRNSVLDSWSFFGNAQKQIPDQKLPSMRRSQFGGTLSGPVRRDKTFFLGSFEGLRESSYRETTFSVPTELERRGDFSRTFASPGNMVRIYNPFTTRANPAGSGYIRDQFQGNVIPSTLFDPVAVNVARYYPQANRPGDPVTKRQNYYNTGAQQNTINQFDGRIDHNISSTQRFFARYSHRKTGDIPPMYFPKELAVAEGRIIQEDRVRGAVADYTNTLNPTTVLSARLGFARTLYVYSNQALGFLPSSLGLPKDIDTAADRLMFPAFSGAIRDLGGGDHRWNAFMTYSLLGSLTKVKGPHTIKVGGEGRMIRVNVWEARNAASFSFGAGMTQGPNPSAASSTAGNGLASMLLGTGSSGDLIQAWKNVAAQSFYFAGYVQDDWRATSKLTFNLGLRYDIDTPRTERYNRINYFDPLVVSPLAKQVPQFPDLRGGLIFVGVDGNSRYQYKTDRNDWAPRLGLAYKVTPKTVVRAGYGHVFALSSQAAQGTIGPFGFRVQNSWVTSLDGITPYNLLRNPYPQGFRPPPGAADRLMTAVGGDIQAVMWDTPTPWSQQWNLTIQRELPMRTLLEVAYVGTRGLQLSRGGEGGFTINQLRPELMSMGSALNQTVDNPFYGKVNTGVLAAQRVSRAQLLRPYPQFTTIFPLFSAGSSSTYHSMQATASKRLSRGLQFEGSYTWSKLMDNGESHQDSYNVAASRSLSDLHIPHRFVMGYVYELPFGRGRHFGSSTSRLLDLALGGWQVNGITTFQSGGANSIGASNTAGVFGQAIRANNNGKSGKLEGPVHERLGGIYASSKYFDTTVFSQPAPFTFGNMTTRVNDIRSDGSRNFDVSLFKNFKITERLSAQFRAEALNAFNTPRFSGPNTSVTSSSFGIITGQANSPRQIQFGLKLLW